jgi:hypothetical protein
MGGGLISRSTLIATPVPHLRFAQRSFPEIILPRSGEEAPPHPATCYDSSSFASFFGATAR